MGKQYKLQIRATGQVPHDPSAPLFARSQTAPQQTWGERSLTQDTNTFSEPLDPHV